MAGEAERTTQWQPSRPRLRRILWYRERVLANGGFTTSEAVNALEVSERTLYRDAAYIRTLGWELEFCRVQNRWFAPNGQAPLPLASLGEGELVALLAAERAFRTYAGTPYLGAVRSAFRKIIQFFDAPITVDLNDLLLPCFSGPPARQVDTDQYVQLSTACRERRRLEIDYRSPERREVTTRRVDPYRLLLYGGDPYVIAYDDRRGQVITFALGRRMRAIRETGETFEADPTFDLERYQAEGFGLFRSGPVEDVSLLFSPAVSDYLSEKVWDDTETQEELPDGSLRLRMRVPVNIGLVRFVLQYGADVRVEAPAPLQQQIRRAYQQASELYDDSDSGAPHE